MNPLLAEGLDHRSNLSVHNDRNAHSVGSPTISWATIVAVLGEARRFAEKIEVLDEMQRAALARNDALALWKIEWEQSWSRDGEAAAILPTAGPETTQLTLEFC